jgi:hypothetical protein
VKTGVHTEHALAMVGACFTSVTLAVQYGYRLSPIVMPTNERVDGFGVAGVPA